MASISSWTEAIIFSLMFVAIGVVVIGGFNSIYGQSYDLGFNDNSGSQELLLNYQDTAQQQIEGGEVQFDAASGIQLKTSWGLLKDIGTIIWKFVSGGWIEQVINSWNLGQAGTILAFFLRILFFISVLFSFLYTLFKVVT